MFYLVVLPATSNAAGTHFSHTSPVENGKGTAPTPPDVGANLIGVMSCDRTARPPESGTNETSL